MILGVSGTYTLRQVAPFRALPLLPLVTQPSDTSINHQFLDDEVLATPEAQAGRSHRRAHSASSIEKRPCPGSQ